MGLHQQNKHPVPWHRMLFVLLGLTLLAALAPPTFAQDDIVRPAISDPTWQATYWNNPTLSGAPAVQRSETILDYNWGSGSPDPAIPADGFSARWTRYLLLDAGVYRFTATSDDGVRVFVDDRLLIDGWSDHPTRDFSADLRLAAGHHLIRVEYYERADQALVRLAWSLVTGDTPTVQNWRGEYFNNRDLIGTPALVREDVDLSFDWGTGSPAAGIVTNDGFSARWTRTINFPTGNYRFRVAVDDGARLWVNNALIIDQWREQGLTSYSSDIYLPGGNVPVRLEYFENVGGATVRLTWERTDQPPPPTATPTPATRWRGEYFNNRDLSGPPAVVRDDSDINFDWGGGSPAPGIINNDRFSVRWTRTFDLAAGIYRFRIWVDDGARLWVNNQLIIDQWRVQAETAYSAEIRLSGGSVPIKLEYYEEGNAARIRLIGERIDQPPPPTATPPATGRRWRGEYFNNRDVSGTPALVREDRAIDFNWGNSSPSPGIIAPDNFAARWTITLNFGGGRYRFTTETDDGVRLYIDDRLVINQWREQPQTRLNVELDLSRGDHRLRMEYFDRMGAAVARLGWRKIGDLPPPPVGNIITCVPPQPDNYAWIRLYRLNSSGNWYLLGRGIGSVDPRGYLKIDGLAVDTARFGNAGEPYRVEQWIDGRVARSTGNFQVGEPEFRVRPYVDSHTPWQCR
jgi:hypothetical protein